MAVIQVLQAEGHPPDLMHPTAGQAAKSNNLSLMQPQAEFPDGAKGYMVKLQGYLSSRENSLIFSLDTFLYSSATWAPWEAS